MHQDELNTIRETMEDLAWVSRMRCKRSRSAILEIREMLVRTQILIQMSRKQLAAADAFLKRGQGSLTCEQPQHPS